MTIFVAQILNRHGVAWLSCHTEENKAHQAIKDFFKGLNGKYMDAQINDCNDYEYAFRGDLWIGNIFERTIKEAE